MGRRNTLKSFLVLTLCVLLATSALVPTAFAKDETESWDDDGVAARPVEGEDLGESEDEDRHAIDGQMEADGDFDVESDAQPAAGDSDSETPPNPRHMWSPQNMAGEDAVMLMSTYGTSWSGKNFYNGYGNLWCANGKKVIDVSFWNSTIDWAKVKNSDVDGAVLRIGYGEGVEDTRFAQNLAGVRSVGMPYGVYLYSYAYDADFARQEANGTADLLDKYGCKDLSLPIFYDIEAFEWSAHATPTTPAQYEPIIRTYIDTMAARGYKNVQVYSYRSYMQNRLKSDYIWSKTSWIAEYGSSLNITNDKYSGDYGWQYTSSGSVNGINGDVDLSAFIGFSAGGFNVANLNKVTIPDGEYYINSTMAPASGVDLRGGGTTSGTVTQLYRGDGVAAQKFVFARQSDGSYVIKNAASGRVLDVSGGQAANSAKVQLWDENGSTAQRWFIRDSGSGYYLQSALGNWVLDINGGSSANGTAITLYTPNGTDAQKFMLASTDESGIIEGLPVSVTLADNDGFGLDVTGGSLDDGAAAQLYAKNGTDAQLFVFKRTGNGVYSIQNVKSGKMLDVWSGSVSDSAKVDQYQDNGTAAQRWCVRSYGNKGVSLVSFKSGKALDVRSGVIASGTPLQIYSANGTAAQRWRLTRSLSTSERASQAAKDHKGTVSPGSYYVKSAKDASKVLDAAGAGLSCGTNVWLYQKNNTAAQQWAVSEDADGYLTFINENSGLALDVSGGVANNGANVQLYSPNGTKAQKWIAQKADDGSVSIVSAANPDFSLDLSAGQTANQTNVQLYASNGTAAQKYVLEEAARSVPDGTYVILSAKNRNTALDVQWGSMSNGANVWLYDVNNTVAQQWKVTNNADGTLMLVNVKSNKALDIYCGGTASGTNVWQYASNGTTAQRWIPISNADGSITLRSASNPKLALDVSAGQAVSGSNIQVYALNGTAAQNFMFKAVN